MFVLVFVCLAFDSRFHLALADFGSEALLCKQS